MNITLPAATAEVLRSDLVPGHWHGPEGHRMALEYASKDRATLAMAERSDMALANAIFLVGRQDHELIALQSAAKERIRWLSVQLALARRHDAALLSWAKKRETELAGLERITVKIMSPSEIDELMALRGILAAAARCP